MIKKLLLCMTLVFLVGFVAGTVCATDANAATLSTKAEKAYKSKVKAIKKNAANVKYSFLDVDGDGQKEMLTQDRYDYSSTIPAEVYKYKGGKAVRILKVGSGNDGWWNFKFCKYYPKTKSLVFKSSHTTGTPTTCCYYKWSGKKFVLKVKKVYYEANIKATLTYKKGNAATIRSLEKGNCKKAGSLSWKTC